MYFLNFLTVNIFLNVKNDTHLNKDAISGMLSPHCGSVKVEDLALQQGLNDVSKASSERRKKFNGACPMRNDHGEVYCCIKNSRTQWGQTFLEDVF